MSFAHPKHERRNSVPSKPAVVRRSRPVQRSNSTISTSLSIEKPPVVPTKLSIPPERRTVVLQDLTFSSDFETGNGAFEDTGTPNQFCVWTQPDCCGTEYENTNRSWFHFSVAGGRANRNIQLQVRGMNKLKYLYDRGMRPVLKRSSMNKYERIADSCAYVPEEVGASITWTHRFAEDDETVFFAFSFPYSYTESEERVLEVQQRVEAVHDLYVHSELLCRTPQGRNMRLLTISSTKGMLEEQEAPIDRLFPEGSERPQRFQGKQVVFVSARVHPGEVPAQFVLDGFLQFALHPDDRRSRAFRDCFVLKVIPMLNPDGVAMGHYRSDCFGTNLNRCYAEPDFERAPTIYAAKEVVRQLVGFVGADQLFYFDLHAHANKRGCFMYGNNSEDPGLIAQIQRIPKLITLSTQHFHFDQCNFSVENMKKVDKRDGNASKEGSGRVALFLEFGLSQAYTLECNYNDGPYVNQLPVLQGEKSTIRRRPLAYSQSHFADVGKGIALACLDCVGANPRSRLEASSFKTVQAVEDWIIGPDNLHGPCHNRFNALPEIKEPKRRPSANQQAGKVTSSTPSSARGVGKAKALVQRLNESGSAAE